MGEEASGHRCLLAPLEGGTIGPHAMEDDGELAGERDLGLLVARLLGQSPGPALERTVLAPRQQHVGGLARPSSAGRAPGSRDYGGWPARGRGWPADRPAGDAPST